MAYLSLQEMVAVIDRHTTFDAAGFEYQNVVKMRDELEYQWGFEPFQVTNILFEMRDRGLMGYSVCD